MISEGLLDCFRLGGKLVRITRETVEQFEANSEKATVAPMAVQAIQPQGKYEPEQKKQRRKPSYLPSDPRYWPGT